MAARHKAGINLSLSSRSNIVPDVVILEVYLKESHVSPSEFQDIKYVAITLHLFLYSTGTVKAQLRGFTQPSAACQSDFGADGSQDSISIINTKIKTTTTACTIWL